MVNNKRSASLHSVQELRHAVAQSFQVEGDVLLNLIDALAVGPRPESAVEVTLSPAWGYDFSNLYTSLNRAAQKLAGDLEGDDWLQKLRQGRLAWLSAQPLGSPNPATGKWGVRILDATDYPRPKTSTVELGYVHSAEGMRLGHGLSLLSERVGEGSWTLPLEIGWIPPQSHPIIYGVVQIEQFRKRHGWKAEQALVVDAQYTAQPFLKPVHKLGIAILGRVASHRVFYLPPPAYRGFGRPPVRGRKIKLNDGRTLPPIDAQQAWKLDNGRRIEVSRWNDIRMRQWPDQSLTLYRVIEFRVDGKPRYQRPLWLIFVPADQDTELPAPSQAQAMYQERFGIEHSIRFLKRELGLTAGQFNSTEAEGRLQVWVEIVATVFWFLWALSGLAKADDKNIPKWWRSGKTTPGVVRKTAAGLLIGLGWKRPDPKPRGKSPGRAKGTRLEPRKQFEVHRIAAR
jgi:DDE superfamily endonuclease